MEVKYELRDEKYYKIQELDESKPEELKACLDFLRTNRKKGGRPKAEAKKGK